ncbi:serine palmitoyltransferase [Rickenella mellea]|uniref:serine C-palmitoyltransferase n=1 Tax=Rickenella mellea TaxID=50990 RepID=A0A4Y7QJW2_9AGAM|nr:serine palmitoyltransferase [Rickenella mellea]
MDDVEAALKPVVYYLSYALAAAEYSFYKIPGSAVIARYVKSSHQNDPGRTLLELLLVIFAISTLLHSRTRADKSGRHFIKFTEKEIDELVDEWNPEPLAQPLDEDEQADLAAVPVIAGASGPRPTLVGTGKTVLNLASYNFAGLAGNETIKDRAIETLRKYGLGSCGPPGFYGTIDVHMDLERDIASFLGTEAAILYSQGFSTISSVIPAFCKRGDVIVVDRGVNFAIQKGIQISRSTIRWFDHNDLNSLVEVLEGVEKERRKRKGPLTRRFIVTEGVFENDGKMVDLPKLIELKLKYKYRLILDESFSFGTTGRTGRGLTEFYNIPASQVDMLVGSVANGLNSSGGFCAGSKVVVDHQRINGTSFVFSAAMPALLAVSASEGIRILQNSPQTGVLERLRENVRAVRGVLGGVRCVEIPSCEESAIVHLYIRSSSSEEDQSYLTTTSAKNNPTSAQPRNPPTFHIASEERLLQHIVAECLSHGVMVTRAKRLRGQEMVEPRPSIKLALSAALKREECVFAATVIGDAFVRVLEGEGRMGVAK